MRIQVSFVLGLAILMSAHSMLARTGSVLEQKSPTPVLVELFTSEGCSSCPPADRFLETLDHQPVSGAKIIVLSEHVDYWDHLGWKDPYSSHLYSARQGEYGRRFGLNSVYTPQVIVDGSGEFVGSDTSAADKVFTKALIAPKIPVHLSLLSKRTESLELHVDVGLLEPSLGAQSAVVYVAVALDRAESHVPSGENAGHTLRHVAVLRQLSKVAVVKQNNGLSQNIHLDLGQMSGVGKFRLIAFVQELQQGKVLGSDLLTVGSN